MLPSKGYEKLSWQRSIASALTNLALPITRGVSTFIVPVAGSR